MNIKIFRFFILLSFFLSSFSYAATFNFSDYLFKSKSQNGFFIGLELADNNNANYYTNYFTSGSEPKPEDVPNMSLPDGEYSLIYGVRYYLKSKNFYLNRLGFGFKGWYSQQTNNDVDRNYIGSLPSDLLLKIDSTVDTFGNEGQIYFDLLRFSAYKVNNAIGISLGAGYEFKNYSNFKFAIRDSNAPPFVNLNNYFKLNSIIYDASLYYTFANHLRVDVGYKITNYSTYKDTRYRYNGNYVYASVVEISPKNEYFYISTSFQF